MEPYLIMESKSQNTILYGKGYIATLNVLSYDYLMVDSYDKLIELTLYYGIR